MLVDNSSQITANARNGQGKCLTTEKLQCSHVSESSRVETLWSQRGESVCVWVCVCGRGVPLKPSHRALANLDNERPHSHEQQGRSCLEIIHGSLLGCQVKRPKCQGGDILSFKEACVQKAQQ